MGTHLVFVAQLSHNFWKRCPPLQGSQRLISLSILTIYYLLSIALFSKLGLDKGGQWNEIEHKIGEGQRSGEGKVDGDVGPGFEDLVQLDAGVAVPLHQVVRPVQVPI